MKRQQLLDRPAMIGNPGCHGRCPLDTRSAGHRGSETQACVIRTEVVDRTDQIHPVPQCQHTARQRSAATGQRRHAGAGRSIPFKIMAETIVRAVGLGRVEYVGWPEGYEKEGTGDFVTDITKAKTIAGWEPVVSFEEGAYRMVAYYRAHLSKYVS